MKDEGNKGNMEIGKYIFLVGFLTILTGIIFFIPDLGLKLIGAGIFLAITGGIFYLSNQPFGD